MKFHRIIHSFPVVLALVALGCESTSKVATPCRSADECGPGFVCVAYGGGAAMCTPTCSTGGSTCSASAVCAEIAVLDVNVCQPASSEGTTADPEEQPHVPCLTDAECKQVASNAVCAEFMGGRDCSLPCVSDDACNPPPLIGVTYTFNECAPDQGDASRSVCLPDLACFNNPFSCIDGIPGGGLIDAGFPEHDASFGGECTFDDDCPGGYSCGFDACATSCEDNFDCKFEYGCSSGECVPN